MPELNVTLQEVEDALHSFVHMCCDLECPDRRGFTFPEDIKVVDDLLQKVYDHVQGNTT